MAGIMAEIPMYTLASSLIRLKGGGCFCFYHEWSQIVRLTIVPQFHHYVNDIIFPQKVVNRRDTGTWAHIPCLF